MTVICVFGYNRPEHLHLTLRSLSRNFDADRFQLRVYIDGPRDCSEAQLVCECIEIARFTTGFKSIEVISSDSNKGLFRSITDGVADALEIADEVIVLEDDMITSREFIRFMHHGLTTYKYSCDVAAIQGFNPAQNISNDRPFFLPGTDCWGWATWKDRWDLFRNDACEMHDEILSRGLARTFNLNGTYDYMSLLRDTGDGKVNSWAICWHASMFLSGKLSLYPPKSLVHNIGLDGSGQHCGPSVLLDTFLMDSTLRIDAVAPHVCERIFLAYCRHFHQGWRFRAKLKLNSIKQRLSNAAISFMKLISQDSLTITGPYSTYKEALNQSSGYTSSEIIAKVRSAAKDVLDGKGNYERDGTLFRFRDSRCRLRKFIEQYSTGGLTMLDIGGGLGSTYINNLDLVNRLGRLIVLETPEMCRSGRELSEEYNLPVEYVDSMEEVDCHPDIVIMSSVLQYVAEPNALVKWVKSLEPKLIFIDRTTFANSQDSIVFRQVMKNYYSREVSYPIWLLSSKLLEPLISEDYLLLDEWESELDHKVPRHMGLLLEKVVDA